MDHHSQYKFTIYLKRASVGRNAYSPEELENFSKKELRIRNSYPGLFRSFLSMAKPYPFIRRCVKEIADARVSYLRLGSSFIGITDAQGNEKRFVFSTRGGDEDSTSALKFCFSRRSAGPL